MTFALFGQHKFLGDANSPFATGFEGKGFLAGGRDAAYEYALPLLAKGFEDLKRFKGQRRTIRNARSKVTQFRIDTNISTSMRGWDELTTAMFFGIANEAGRIGVERAQDIYEDKLRDRSTSNWPTRIGQPGDTTDIIRDIGYDVREIARSYVIEIKSESNSVKTLAQEFGLFGNNVK